MRFSRPPSSTSQPSPMAAMCPSPLKESNHLWLLAEASLSVPLCSAPPPLVCADSGDTQLPDGCAKREPTEGIEVSELLWANESIDGEGGGQSSMLKRRPTPATEESSSRSSSPAMPGRTYLCKKCEREYASADAVRKHCRQNHPAWLREQGQGCPLLYCSIVDTMPKGSDGAVANLSSLATPPTCTADPSSPSDDQAGLFGAVQSFLAFSKAAIASSSLAAPAAAAIDAAASSPLDAVATPVASSSEVAWRSTSRTGHKRPRSVRCGKCDGCERDDCGTCKNCLDKPKFGGMGQRKQGCIAKICRQPRMAI